MANIALNKLPLESVWTNPEVATNGIVTGYTGTEGFAWALHPTTYTLDLGQVSSIEIVQFLLWDGMGESATPDSRKYTYQLSASSDNVKWKTYYVSGQGWNGWQIIEFRSELRARYIRLTCEKNTANPEFHIVEFEIYEAGTTVKDYREVNFTNKAVIEGFIADRDHILQEIADFFEAKQTQINEDLNQILENTRRKEKSIIELETELQMKTKAVDSTIRQLGLIDKSLDFQKEAGKNKTWAGIWLAFAIAAFVGFFITMLIFLFGKDYYFIGIAEKVHAMHKAAPGITSDPYLFEAISFFASKFLFLSLLIYVVVFCSRNFRTQRHNYSINQHKALSLISAVQFLDKEDLAKETREKILTQATSTIFSHQDSGFSDGKEDAPGVINNLIETMK